MYIILNNLFPNQVLICIFNFKYTAPPKEKPELKKVVAADGDTQGSVISVKEAETTRRKDNLIQVSSG